MNHIRLVDPANVQHLAQVLLFYRCRGGLETEPCLDPKVCESVLEKDKQQQQHALSDQLTDLHTRILFATFEYKCSAYMPEEHPKGRGTIPSAY